MDRKKSQRELDEEMEREWYALYLMAKHIVKNEEETKFARRKCAFYRLRVAKAPWVDNLPGR